MFDCCELSDEEWIFEFFVLIYEKNESFYLVSSSCRFDKNCSLRCINSKYSFNFESSQFFLSSSFTTWSASLKSELELIFFNCSWIIFLKKNQQKLFLFEKTTNYLNIYYKLDFIMLEFMIQESSWMAMFSYKPFFGFFRFRF